MTQSKKDRRGLGLLRPIPEWAEYLRPSGPAIALGGFGDVWRCDARYSGGNVIWVAVKKWRLLGPINDGEAA